MKIVERLTLCLAVIGWMTVAVFPQAQVSSADLKGKITDSTGGVLPGVTVTVTNTEKNLPRSVITDERGEYSFPLLQPGPYELKAEFPGFATQVKRGIQLTVGQAAVIDVVMQVAGTSAEVVVTSEVPFIETERTQQANVIEERRIMNLPINQRDFLDFAKLLPGVTSENPYDTSGLPQLKTSGFSVAGQSSRGNSVTIDGASYNSYAGNSTRGTVSQEAVQEYQVNRSTFSAELGECSASATNLVTKSGTNKYHGNLFYFVRDHKLDARNAFAFGPGGTSFDPPYSRQQWGATLGGPLRKDKTFFFTAYERLDRAQSLFSTFLNDTSILGMTGSQTALVNFLSGIPGYSPLAETLRNTLTTTNFANAPCDNIGRANFPFTMQVLCRDTGVLPFKAQTDKLSTRLDHNITQTHQLYGLITYFTDYIQAFQVAPNRARSNGADNTTRDAGFTITDNYIFNPNLVNEGRFQFATRRLKSLPVTPEGPVFSISGIGDFGRNNNIPSIYSEHRFQFVDNLTLTHGNHRIKTGFDFDRFSFDSETKIFFGGSMNFAEAVPLLQLLPPTGPGSVFDLAARLRGTPLGCRADDPTCVIPPILSQPLTAVQAFNLGIPIYYQQGFGNPNIDIKLWTLAGYVNDTWKVRKNLTFDLGLRYSIELQVPPIHRDKNNFGPRFGFSWDPWSNGKTVIRGGYGIYYSPLFQAVTFVSKVLARDTGIFQLFVPITGVPVQGRGPVTAPEIYRTLRQQNVIGTRTISEQDLAQFGIRVGPNDPNRVIFAVDPNLVNPYSQQVSFGVERELVRNLSLSVNYVMNRGVKLLWLTDTNPRPVGVSRFGTRAYNVLSPAGRNDPTALEINTVESSGSSIYHGMTVELTKRYSRNVQFQVAYTMGKAISDATEIYLEFVPNDVACKKCERGLALADQRQRFVVSGILDSPFKPGAGNSILSRLLADITVSPIFVAESGRPFNLQLGFDQNMDSHNTDRPFFPNPSGPAFYAGKNTGVGPRFTDFDLSVAKKMRLKTDNPMHFELIFQAFNLFNTVNYTGINTTVLMDSETGRPLLRRGQTRAEDVPLTTFRVTGLRGVPSTSPLGFTRAADARQLQLGLKFNF